MSIQRQPKETLEDKVAYEQLKALNHYNKPAGMEAFLHAKLTERRIRLSEANNSLVPSTVPGSLAGKLSVPSPVQQKCSFNITSSMKCGDVCIPMTKFCQKHILNDPTRFCFEHVERSFTRTIRITKMRMDLAKRPFPTFSTLQPAFTTFNSNLQCQLVKRNWIQFGKLKPKRSLQWFWTDTH